MRLVEKSVLRVGRGSLPYALYTTRSRRHVSVGFEPGKGVILVGPRETKVDDMRGVMRRNAGVFFKELRRAHQLQEWSRPRRFTAGEKFLYLGKWYRLKVVRGGVTSLAASLSQGRLVVRVERGLSDLAERRRIKQAVQAFYWIQARTHISARIMKWVRRVGVDCPELILSELDDAWAGYDRRGVIYFDWRIIQAPLRVLDAVIVHELAHIDHLHHGRSFWAKVAKVLPDHEERDKALLHFEPAMRW